MGWLFFEIVLALALAIGIVWWTFPKSARREQRDDEPEGPDGER